MLSDGCHKETCRSLIYSFKLLTTNLMCTENTAREPASS